MPRIPHSLLPSWDTLGNIAAFAALLAGIPLLLEMERRSSAAQPTTVQAEAWPVDVAGTSAPLAPLGRVQAVQGQKKAPCHRLEVEARDVCWIPHAVRPPCPVELVAWQGQCLLPVMAMQRPATSIQQ